MAPRTPLFVVGLSRSGTTALVEVLGEHPRVVLGQERFKKLWGPRIRELTPALLERERFFDFGDGLTNIRPDVHERWAGHYRRAERKFDDAAYVGDKMTVARMQVLWELHPAARFVCIVRDVAEVASSWDARAHDEADANWPERSDSRRAVERWNQQNSRIRRARRQRPDLVRVVEYSSFYGDPEATVLRRVLDWLGLAYDEQTRAAFDVAHRTYVASVAGKDRTLSPETRAFLDEHADRQLWRQLQRLAE